MFASKRPINKNENKNKPTKEKQIARKSKQKNIYKRCMGELSGEIPFKSFAIHREGVWLSL
jgi:hypothetical protein